MYKSELIAVVEIFGFVSYCIDILFREKDIDLNERILDLLERL